MRQVADIADVPDSRAFTLLELLAGVAVMSILVSGFCGVVPVCFKLRNRMVEATEEPLARHYLLERLRGDLLAALPPGGVLASGLTGEYDEASGDVRLDSMEFVTASGTLDADEPWGDLIKVEYCVEESEDEDGYDLVRAVTRNLLPYEEDADDDDEDSDDDAEEEDDEDDDDGVDDGDTDEDVLLTGVRSFEITYYDGEDWVDSWDSDGQDNELPMAVRVVIEFVPGDAVETDDEETTESPELVVPLVVQARAAATEEEDESGSPAPEETPPE